MPLGGYSDDDEDADKPYHQRAEWSDVVPVQQNDGPLPLVVIRYPPGFEEAHDYLRAIMSTQEFSERALKLTADVIEHNSANYSAWWYRRRCLSALKSDLDVEMELTNAWATNNSKNYQVWYHRRWLVSQIAAKLEASEDPTKAEKLVELGRQELEYHADVMMLNDDYKNYNGWSHRLFAVQKFGLWQGELEFVEGLLAQDIRNNSAWNHRFTVVRNSSTWPLSEAAKQRELKYTLAALRRCANNESAWNYLAGLFGDGDGKEPWDARPEIEALCREVLAAAAAQERTCRFAHEALARVLEAKCEFTEAKSQYKLLQNIDGVRATYWGWRLAVLEKQEDARCVD